MRRPGSAGPKCLATTHWVSGREMCGVRSRRSTLLSTILATPLSALQRFAGGQKPEKSEEGERAVGVFSMPCALQGGLPRLEPTGGRAPENQGRARVPCRWCTASSDAA